MNGELVALVEFVFDELLVLLIVYELTLKALNLARWTPLGQALARANLALAVVFLRVALMPYIPALEDRAWMWAARALVLVTSTILLWEMQRAFGGWRALHARAFWSALDWARQTPPRTHRSEDEGY